MEDVPRMLGFVVFQSNDVRGAQNSEFLFCNVVMCAVVCACVRVREQWAEAVVSC
jgi:hypothetical protein